MVMLPTRPVAVVFAATLKPTDPFPLPLPAVVSVIQVTVLFAAHGHPALVVMPTVPEPPPAGIDADNGCSEIVHETGGGAVAVANCVTASATPPAVMVPVRSAPVFAVTVKLTLPLPDPDSGDGAIHPTSLAAVHAHPEGAPIEIVPVPPDEGNRSWVIVTARSHGDASWRTSARWPLIETALSRGVPLGFGTT